LLFPHTHHLITKTLKLHINGCYKLKIYLHQVIATHIYRVLTTNPNPRAVYRVIWAPGLGKIKLF